MRFSREAAAGVFEDVVFAIADASRKCLAPLEDALGLPPPLS